jgi:anti-sigma-K factor RskA
VRWLAAAAVAAVLAVGATVGIVVAQSGGGGSDQQALADAARAARHAPGAKQVTLADADGQPLANAVVLRDGTGYLTSRLPALADGRTYQLWALVDSERVSLGVMGRDPHVVAFKVNTNAKPAGLAVTNEVAGGVKATHKQPTAVGLIPST